MRFSIIVPVFNSEKFIKRCLDSILNQNFNDYEIIVVDDSSSDKSPLICDNYKYKYENMIVIHKDHEGAIAARKNGLKKSVGEYIVCIDADDYVDSDYLSQIDKNLKKYDNPSMLLWGLKNVDYNGKQIGTVNSQKIRNGVYEQNDLEYLKKVFLYDETISGINYGRLSFSLCTKAVKRELLLDSMFHVKDNIKYGEDLLTTKYIIESALCSRVAVCDYAGYNYMINQNSVINSGYSALNFESYENTIAELKVAFYKEPQKVSIFAIHALIGQLFSITQICSSFSHFKKEVEKTYKYELVWETASRAVVNGGLKEQAKVNAIKKRNLLYIYLYFKTFAQK